MTDEKLSEMLEVLSPYKVDPYGMVFHELEEMVGRLERQAYARGVREGQAKMDNSGRLLYQDGYRAGVRDMREKAKKISGEPFDGELPTVQQGYFYQEVDIAMAELLGASAGGGEKEEE